MKSCNWWGRILAGAYYWSIWACVFLESFFIKEKCSCFMRSIEIVYHIPISSSRRYLSPYLNREELITPQLLIKRLPWNLELRLWDFGNRFIPLFFHCIPLNIFDFFPAWIRNYMLGKIFLENFWFFFESEEEYREEQNRTRAWVDVHTSWNSLSMFVIIFWTCAKF